MAKMDRSEARREAEGLLRALAAAGAELDARESAAEREMAAVRERHEGEIARWRETFGERERALLKFMRSEKAGLFDGGDQVRLAHGILLYAREMRVRIPRDALERIKEQGWEEAINVVESVNRGVVEQWPEERLALIGAERRAKETYGYELIPPKRRDK